MLVTHLWHECRLMDGSPDAFWVACSLQEVDDVILPAMDPDQRTEFTLSQQELCSDRFARNNPNLAKENSWYFLIARDITEICPEAAHFPYAGQWNSWNPFQKIDEVQITSLEELKRLS